MNYYFYPGNDDVFFDALNDINNPYYMKQGVFVKKKIYSQFDKKIVKFRNRLSYHYKKNNLIVRLYDGCTWHVLSEIKEELNNSDEACFIFSNLTIRLIPYKILKQLSNNKNAHLVLYFLDSSNNPLCYEAIELTKDLKFDAVFTFDKIDASRFGFKHIYYIYSRLPQSSAIQHNKIIGHKRIGFWGSDKGRLGLLTNLSNKFSENNISHYFSIIGVKEPEKIKDPDMDINNPIPYREMVNELQNVDIILDIVVPGQSGLSYRTIEALCYNKKILTNNPTILEFPFYDQRYMRYFDSTENIDIDFINDICKIDYKYQNNYSPKKFLETIRSLVE